MHKKAPENIYLYMNRYLKIQEKIDLLNLESFI